MLALTKKLLLSQGWNTNSNRFLGRGDIISKGKDTVARRAGIVNVKGRWDNIIVLRMLFVKSMKPRMRVYIVILVAWSWYSCLNFRNEWIYLKYLIFKIGMLTHNSWELTRDMEWSIVSLTVSLFFHFNFFMGSLSNNTSGIIILFYFFNFKNNKIRKLKK